MNALAAWFALWFAAWFAASLLNALWQTALIFCAAWAAARLARPLGPEAEHRVWVVALLLEAALPFCRFHPELWFHQLQSFFAPAGAGSVSIRMEAVTAGAAAAQPGIPGWLQRSLAAALAVGILSAAAWLAWRFFETHRLLQTAEELEPEGELKRQLEKCAVAAGVDAASVRIALHAELHGPATVGLLRLTLLLPTEFAAEFLAETAGPATNDASEELETTLAHELAHIRRRDFAKNLFYEIATLPVAWHPLAMLTRTQVNQTRELVCDRLAAETLTGNNCYARALVRIAARMAIQPEPRPLAVLGIFDSNIFERRIMQLVRKTGKLGVIRRSLLVAACVAIAFGACWSAMALQADVKPAVEVKNGVATLSPAQAVDNLISKVAPKYPADAKKARIQGTVVLNAIIGTDGHMKELHVLSGPAPLAQSAMEAVQQWVYRPYLLNGKPVQVETTINVIYTLGDTPPAQAAPVAAVSAGGQKTTPHLDARPTLIYSPNPLYPPEASAAHQEGIVLVKTKIDTDGHPTVLGVSGPEVFQKSAREAVEKYIFQPVTENGQPVETTVTIEVNFKLYGNAPKAESYKGSEVPTIGSGAYPAPESKK